MGNLIVFLLLCGAAAVCYLVSRADRRHAFLYRTWGCPHCHNDPCTCARCRRCNHYLGFSAHFGMICKNCGYRIEEPGGPRQRPHDPAPIPGQPVDWSGLGPGGGGYGTGL